MRNLYPALAALLLFNTPGIAEPLRGTATVIDGDTLEIHGAQIRLYGIDAPERGQLCGDARERDYPCGRRAAQALIQKVAGAAVTCEPKSTTANKRVYAICRVGETDLGAWMVRSGLALANRHVSRRYLPQEERAWGAKTGLWAGVFEMPWEWRKQQTAKPTHKTVSADAPVTGAISSPSAPVADTQ